MAADPFAFLQQPPVLIIGAGPTGLAAALWLHKFKIPFRIIDPALEPGTTSRAMIIHARVMEFYDQLGIIDRILEPATIVNGMRIYSKGLLKGAIQYQKAALGQSKYPHILSLGQDVHEAVLNDICAEKGIRIERGVKLLGAREHEDHVRCNLETVESGTIETFDASYVIGADGAHSATRKAAGISMTGGTYANRSYVTDVTVSSTTEYDSKFMNMNLGQHEFCVVIPFTKTRARLIGFVPPDKVNANGELKDTKELTFSEIEDAVRAAAPTVHITGVEWFSTYRVHHRCAERFQSLFTTSQGHTFPGRIFLCGDAGHLHSPVGGQGMNTGIGDATNLAWKIAAVHAGAAPAALLETYETERKAFADTLVNTTDTVFQNIMNRGWKGWFMRNFFMPYVLTTILALFPAVQKRMFRMVSQIGIAYPGSLLSTNGLGVSGSVRAGDRLPWVQVDGSEYGDNVTSLRDARWQAHVYGELGKNVVQLLEDRGIPLKEFPWVARGPLSVNMQLKGLGRDVLYLVRPDGQVGLVAARDDETVLSRYLDRWELGLQTR